LVSFQCELRGDREWQARSVALHQAELIDGSVGNIVEGARQLMIAVSNFDRVRNLDPGCSEALAALRGELDNYAFLTVTDAAGKAICSSAPEPVQDANLQPIVRATLAQGRFTVGQYTPDRTGLHPYLTFGLPTFGGDGKVRALVIAGLSLDWLGHYLAALKLPPHSTIVVGDRNAVILARFPDHARYVGKPFLAETRVYVNKPSSGTAMAPTYEGVMRVIGYVPVTQEPKGLYVSAGFMAADVTTDIDSATSHGYLLIALGIALSLLLALFVGQRFVRMPTAVLLDAARRWGGGDLTVRASMPPGSAAEFTRLGLAFNDLVDTLQNQQKELRALNGQLELRVADRTRALLASNNRLQVEIAERELSEANLRQVQKLQALGQLAGGVAHDFNNLLTVVLGSLELLRKRLPQEDLRSRRMVDTATLAVERGARLTSQLLSFSRKHPLVLVPVNVVAAIEGMTELLASTLGASVRIETRLQPGLWDALLDPNQFEAAILNLALNARDAMPGGGQLTIAADNRALPPGAALPAGDYVCVVVADSGIGMPADVLSRVFEPFFTTKGLGVGSGLGLSQVHGMVQQSGGDIQIESRPGNGTRVTMLVPRSTEAAADQHAHEAMWTAPALTSDQAILLVDDDDHVREVTAAMLVESGYSVIQAIDGPSGLEALRREGKRVQLVIADFVMPGMTGRELLRHVRVQRPDLPMLLATGYADFAALTGDGLPADQIVRKPFRGAELLARIQMVRERHPMPAG
jgi:signal transduction histidine kinase